MRQAARTGALVMVFGVVVTALTTPPACAEPFPTLRVLIVNDARVRPDILARAKVETARIYAEAGVDITWVDPEQVRLGFDLRAVVKSGTQVSRLGRTTDVTGVAMTTPDVPGGTAFAFYDKVQHFALQKGFSTEQILGLVMAHELGHLLLGPGSHSADGLMRKEWEGRDLDLMRFRRLTFTSQQAEAVRRTVRRLTATAF